MGNPGYLFLAVLFGWTIAFSAATASGIIWSDTPQPDYVYEEGVGFYYVIPNHPGQAANITYLDHYVGGAQYDRYVGFYLIGRTPHSDASEVIWSDHALPDYIYEQNVGYYKVISARQARTRRAGKN